MEWVGRIGRGLAIRKFTALLQRSWGAILTTLSIKGRRSQTRAKVGSWGHNLDVTLKQIKLQEHTESCPSQLLWIMNSSKIMIKNLLISLHTTERSRDLQKHQDIRLSLWFGDKWTNTKLKLWRVVAFISDREKDARKENRQWAGW